MRSTRSQTLEPEINASQGIILQSLMAAVMNAANLWDALSHKKCGWLPPYHLMAYNYMPFNNDRKQHPKHSAL